jgi:Brp/Blh family beta-carotene 15,15'-monooxygenase
MSLKNCIKIQGLAFVVFALAISLLSFYLSPAVEHTYLLIIALFIILLGVPHGSLDTLFAQELLGLNTATKWIKFTINYVIIALIVILFWLMLPTIFLICFLLISCLHFADDLVAGTPQLSRILYGGIIIFLPALTYSHELIRLYSFLIDTEHAKLLVSVLKLLAVPWLLALGIVFLQLMRTNIVTSLEVLSVAALALICTPLLAFTIYFCGMHSFRHVIRSSKFLTVTSPKLLAVSLIVPTVAVLVAAYFLWHLMRPTAVDDALVQIIFVALAALTVPHMLLLSKSGFSNWLKIT